VPGGAGGKGEGGNKKRVKVWLYLGWEKLRGGQKKISLIKYEVQTLNPKKSH
jgi:hypothetical protein